jgi:DNA-binding NarL/FixJ family response regulator
MHEEVGRLVAADFGDIGKDYTHRSLSQREFEIFKHLAAGQKVSEIASELGISIKTVSTHKSRLMEKMGMHSHSQLIQYAVANSLFDTSRPS